MPDVNLLAVFLCGVSSMVLGGLWYSPLLFARAWQRLSGVTEEAGSSGGMARILGLAFLLSLLAAYVFALFLDPSLSVGEATAAGAAAGLCWVAAAFGINYLFERRSFALWLINGGYHAVQFTLFGLIIGLML